MAMKEEGKVVKELQNAIYLLASANGHCQIASETDPQWFTLDVQDSHSRRIAILGEVLAKIEAQPIAAPPDLEAVDGPRAGYTIAKGRVLGAFAHTAHATQRAATGLQESERTKVLAAQVGAATNVVAEQAKQVGEKSAALADKGKAAAAVAGSSLTKMLSRGFGTNTTPGDPGGLAPPASSPATPLLQGGPAGGVEPPAPPLHEAYDGAGIDGAS